MKLRVTQLFVRAIAAVLIAIAAALGYEGEKVQPVAEAVGLGSVGVAMFFLDWYMHRYHGRPKTYKRNP